MTIEKVCSSRLTHFLLVWLLLLMPLTVWAQTGWFITSNRFSSGLINDICQDGKGFIWVATDYGLNKFDGYRFTTYLHQRGDSSTLSSNIVGKLYCDTEGHLWVGTAKGLDRYESSTGKFAHYPFADGAIPRVSEIRQLKTSQLYVGTSGYHGNYVLSDGRILQSSINNSEAANKNAQLIHWDDCDTSMHFINHVLTDSRNRFWQCAFGNEFTMKDTSGLHRMKSTQGFVVDFAERGDEVLIICLNGIHSFHNGHLSVADIDMSAVKTDILFRSVCVDRHGNIWLGTRGDGLFCLAHNSKKLEHIVCHAKGIDLKTAKVWAITEDRQGNIWLGCQSRGLLMLQRKAPQFQSWSFPAQGLTISSTVTSICEGDDDMTWCTIQGNGVYGFDQDGRIVAHPSAPSTAECIYRDAKKRYWLGTENSLYTYNPQTGQSELQVSFECDQFHCMVCDSLGRLYISTFSRGFCVFDPLTRQLRNFNSSQQNEERGWLYNDWVMSMTFDHIGRLWLATSSGVSCYDPKADIFIKFQDKYNILDNVLCYSLCETSSGDMVIGTAEGLYVWRSNSHKVEPFSSGLPDKVVGYVTEDNEGDLWCATSMGIWHYNHKNQRFIGHVSGNGLTAREYINCVGMKNSRGFLCFADNEGLTVFHPQDVTGSHASLPHVVLTNFLIAGKPQHISSNPSTLTVSYLDNVLALEFSLLDYNNPSSIVYEYRIGGGKWVTNPEGQNSIQLSRLQPGNYQIDVRATTTGIYSPVTTLTIEVTPPWYRSTMAQLLYIIGVLGVLVALGFMWRRNVRRRLDEEKMKFLINATHDIRSPLTLIMGPLAKLKTMKIDRTATEEELSTFNSQLSTHLDIIDRNAHRLMLLVNQILDERRIDKKQMQLHCRETNLVEFITGICKLFQYNASHRNITFTFEHDKEHVMAWIDRINFDKVISNLLSNAFKYTFDGGEIKVVLQEQNHDIKIQVIDNGMGIKDEDKEHIFDRFYQGLNADSIGMQGTGIGLNLSQNIVKMHGGHIKAENHPDGKQGTCFTITIPLGNSHLRPEQIVSDSPSREVLSSGSIKQHYRKFHILIADDDPEIADYIISALGDKYKFEHAPNGKEALKTLLTGQYDLVISDVMMPEMDGLTLLKNIKNNPNISQLPVIMLTSKAEVEHKLEGLKCGADAYISKPFNMDELHIQIDNLIDNVRRLKGKFSGALQQEERMEKVEVKGNNDALMDRIMHSVNAHISDPNFNVDTLASDVGISRAQLHRKMKEITGTSSGQFLRNLRMEQASRLLREGKINVTQVGESVGYNDQTHFSTAFKNHFGLSPSEYMEKNKES